VDGGARAESDRHQIVYSDNAGGDMVGYVVDVTPSGCEAAVRRWQRMNMEVLCSLRGFWQSERKERAERHWHATERGLIWSF
jgi:hypothetical protein